MSAAPVLALRDAVGPRDRRFRAEVGMIFQSPSLDGKLTARENLRLAATLHGLGGATRDERVTTGLELAHLMAVALLPLWMLSGAMFPASEGWLEVAMLADPMTYMVDAVRHALYGGTAPVSVVGPGAAAAVVLAFAAGGFALATATLSRVQRWKP